MVIKIEDGSYYVTRSGRHVGPMVRQNSSLWAFRSKGTNSIQDEWDEEGKWTLYTVEHPNDIVAECRPGNNPSSKISPIRTRREIVPGKFGIVLVCDENGHIEVDGRFNADELREAAHLFNQIAEVLEENAG